MDVRLPNGTVIRNVPEGTTKSQLLAKLKAAGYKEEDLLRPAVEAPPTAPAEESGFFRQAADIPVKALGGVATGVRLITDAFGADNAVSQNIRGVEGWINGLLSAQAKQDQQEVARIMKEAENKGVLDQVMAGLRAFQVAPLDTIAQAAGTTAPVLVGGLATALLRAPAVLGVVGTGAVMGAGTSKSAIYDATYEVLRESGASEAEAKNRASEAQEYGGKNLDQILLGTALGGVAGRFGAEDVVARRLAGEISRRSLAKAAVSEAATEFTQAGQEQLAANIAQQREGFAVPTMRGVVSSGTMEALAGAAVGAGAEAIGRPRGEMPTTLPGGETEVAPPAPPPPPPAAPPAARPSAIDTAPDDIKQELSKVRTPKQALAALSQLESRLASLSETLANPEDLAELSIRSNLDPVETEERLRSRADAIQSQIGFFKQRLDELSIPPVNTTITPVPPIPQVATAQQTLDIGETGVPTGVVPSLPSTVPVTPFAAEPQQLGIPGVPSAVTTPAPQVTGQAQPPAVGGGPDVSAPRPVSEGPSAAGPELEGVETVAGPPSDVAGREGRVEPALTKPDRISERIISSNAGSDFVKDLYSPDPVDAVLTSFEDLDTVTPKEINQSKEYIKSISQNLLRNEFGDEVTLYRGLKGTEERSPVLSYTLNEDVAKFQATQQGIRTGKIEEIRVPVSEVLSYSQAIGRGTFAEDEVIIPASARRVSAPPAVEPAPTPAPAPAEPAAPTLREDATDEEIAAYYKAREEADRAARRKAKEEEVDEQRGEVALTPQIPVQEVKGIVDEAVKGWTNAPRIFVVANANDPVIPQSLRDRITPNTKGIYSNGTVYIIADRAINKSGVRGTVFHESLGHFGLREIFGNRLDKLLEDIYRTNKDTRVAADALMQQYPDLSPARAVNEVLAQRSEAGPIKNAGIRAAFNRVSAFIRRVGRAMNLPISYSNNDVAQIIAQAHRRVTEGLPSKPSTVAKQIRQLKDFLNGPVDEFNSREPLGSTQRRRFKEVYNTVADYLRKPMLGIQDLYDLAELYKNEVPSLQGLIDIVNARAYSLKQRQLVADDNVRRWAGLLKKHSKQLGKFYSIALESTRLQVDFDDPADSGHSLTKEFNQLHPDLQTVYREMRDAYRKMADEYLELIVKNLPPTAANEFRKNYEAKRLKVYFPLYREGNYWLRYQDKNNNTVVRAFMSRRARRLAERDAAAQGATGFQPYEKIEDVFNDPQAGFGFYSKAMGELDAYYMDKYGEPAPLILKQNLYEMFLDTIPAASIRQQFRKREGYLGAEQDLLGVYATMAPRMLNQLNNLEFNPQLDEVVKLVNEDIEKQGTSAANDLRLEVKDRLEFLRDPTNSKWVNFGVFASYFDFIIGNLSSAAANLTNLAMSVYPMLGAEYGYDKTALAMEDATKMWFGGGWDNDGKEGVPNRWPADRTAFDPSKVPSNSPLGRLFEAATRENVLKHSVAYDLLEARGQRQELKAGFLSTLTGTNDYMGLWNKTKQALGWAFQNSERFNREVALIAAFNLGIEKGKTEKEAIRDAMRVVRETNGTVLTEVGPRFFQKGVLKVAFTFKNFARTQYHLQYRLIKDIINGTKTDTTGMSPEEAKKARQVDRQFRMMVTKQWLGTLAGAFTFAGIQGLPFYGAAIMLASALDDDDEPMDPDERLKQAYGSLPFKGPVNQIFMTDLASRTGFNGMLWRDDPKRLGEIGAVLFTLEQLMGPAYGSLRSRMDAYEDFKNGYTDRALEKTMPVFIRNMLKSWRYAKEGVLTKEKDVKITDDPDAYELFMQFAGFAPVRISEATARSGARKEIQKRIESRKNALYQNYYNAYVLGDREGVIEALQDIDKFNASKMARDYNAYIRKEDILRSRKERERRARQAVEGYDYPKKMRPGLEREIQD